MSRVMTEHAIGWHHVLVALGLAVVLIVSGCQMARPIPTVTVSIVYGSEKEEWLKPLVAEYNQAAHKTASGAVIAVEATPMGSIESVHAIIEGKIQPTVWSPASSVYLPVANAEWRKRNAADLVEGTPNALVLSPVIIGMWEPMARKLGWPDTPIGWADIARLAVSEEGWAAYDRPEWGSFKFGHTHPNFSNSGVVAILAEAYAAAGKTRNLSVDDLKQPSVRTFMEEVESAIIHYGSSTGFFATRMFERGPSYLSAAVMYENLVVAQERKRLSGESNQLPVVAIYPKEGTFWTDNPYVILNAGWVTDEQRAAALDFEKYLRAESQQRRAMDYGFRPADPAIALGSPLDAQHGVNPNEPQTLLEVPSAEVIEAVLALWKEVKKPVDLVLVIDTSGSMAGDKIASARNSVAQFIDRLEDRDNLAVISFSDMIITLSELSPLGPKRDDTRSRVLGLVEAGDTRLYDVTLRAYRHLLENGNPRHIRAVVLLTDGRDTASDETLEAVLAAIADKSEEGGRAIKMFTIAFGSDADRSVLQQIAEVTGGRMYEGEPRTIAEVYAQIATFF